MDIRYRISWLFSRWKMFSPPNNAEDNKHLPSHLISSLVTAHLCLKLLSNSPYVLRPSFPRDHRLMGLILSQDTPSHSTFILTDHVFPKSPTFSLVPLLDVVVLFITCFLSLALPARPPGLPILTYLPSGGLCSPKEIAGCGWNPAPC